MAIDLSELRAVSGGAGGAGVLSEGAMPKDVTDLVCDLDVVMEDLKAAGYSEEAELVKAVLDRLTAGLELRLKWAREVKT